MSARRSRQQERCAYEDCGSRRFHEGADGYTYCDQGHQQSERGAAIATDTGELVVLGRTSRKRESDAESATSKASSFSGPQAFSHYLLCVQLVLRKQVFWLINTQRLPGELEHLVKDLWALRLQKLQSRIAYESETETEALSSQVFSSQTESEATSASLSTRRKRRKKEQVQEGSSKLVETLALCYIGLLLLRVPVTVADVHEWTNDGQLLYYCAGREVPLGMRERLPPRYQASLEPQDLLPPATLHQNVLDLLDTFNSEVGMTPPSPNIPLLLYRWLRRLMLPIEVYSASLRLAQLLDVTFEFVLPSKACANVNLRCPETRLMAVVVAATKLLFPPDRIERSALSRTALSSVGMDWKAWMKSAKQAEEAAQDGSLHFAQAFRFDETDCAEASDNTLDAYLDWYQSNIATEEIRERGKAGREADFRRAMFGMFPMCEPAHRSTAGVGAGSQNVVEDRLRKLQSTIRPRAIQQNRSSEDGAHAVGSSYRRFRSALELTGPAKVFYERAAELAGLSIEDMVQAVFSIERMMQKLEERIRRAEDD